MTRYCGTTALVVGGDHRLPADPCEYNYGGISGAGCNNLRCESCGARVRSGEPGFRLKDGRRPADLPGFHAAKKWTALPHVVNDHRSWRLYACQCSYWEEGSEHFLVNDHDSPSDPHMRWVCDGHPIPTLPLTLGRLEIDETTDCAVLVRRVLEGECPRRLEQPDEGPTDWLSWLYAYLRGVPIAAKLSRAVGDQMNNANADVVASALAFFRRFPVAEGVDRVVERAESDPLTVFVGHKIPERDYRPRVWDVFIAALQQRTDVNDALDIRIIKIVREAMVLPAGNPDAVKQTLSNWANANAFHADDLAWMAENIASIERAGRGRWNKILNLLKSAARRGVELDHSLVIAGIALIQSGEVDHAEIRAWIQANAGSTDAWALPLQSALADGSIQ